jgi:hypothetical protein
MPLADPAPANTEVQVRKPTGTAHH